MRTAGGGEWAGRASLGEGWAKRRPEELTAKEFVEVARLIFGERGGGVDGDEGSKLPGKVWR